MNSEEDKKFFNSIAGNYLKKDFSRYGRIARKLRLYRTLRNIPKPITSILEVGCGAGFSALYLKELCHRFIGIDHSENLIAYAQKYNSSKNSLFFCQSINSFSSSEKFQVILMIGVLHHLPDVKEVLVKLKSYLEPNGIIAVNEPQNGNPLISFMRKIRKKFDQNYSVSQVEFSETEIKNLFIECGYSIKCFPQGILSTPLAESVLFPVVIGFPLALLFKVIDPILENIFSITVLRKLAWNMVVEARVVIDGKKP